MIRKGNHVFTGLEIAQIFGKRSSHEKAGFPGQRSFPTPTAKPLGKILGNAYSNLHHQYYATDPVLTLSFLFYPNKGGFHVQ